MDYKQKLLRFTERRSFKYGLPFVLFVVGGSIGLREFADLRYRYKQTGTPLLEEMEAAGVELKKEKVTLESEYLKIQKMDIENWKNIRIPRPWEENGVEK